jgi:hypothetical protein
MLIHRRLPRPPMHTRRIHRIVNPDLSILLVEEIEQVLATGIEDLGPEGLRFGGGLGPEVVVGKAL